MKMTYERLKIVNALKEGPKSWSVLRVIYYADKGPERIASCSTTSFMNQVNKMIAGGVIKKTDEGYALVVCMHETHENGGPNDYGPECQPNMEVA